MHSHFIQQMSTTTIQACLNPCFNGRCTRTIERINATTSEEVVLILVLMEDALARRRSWLPRW